jgi:UDP-N-acetylmuramate--alanine ligase
MHIFFSGIGGTGIGPLALIAKQAGYEVSGSDKQDSQYIQYLKKKGIHDIYIGQTTEAIARAHKNKPIDWYVFSSAIEKELDTHPEITFVTEHNIKNSKRDLLLNHLIKDRQLKLLAVAGTHGKTTTTAMVVYLMKALELPISYSVGAKISFGDMGQYDPRSEYFVLECDEFDRNFLGFSPYMAIISGIGYDHHEIYPTEESYRQAFRDFIGKSAWKHLWQSDFVRLGLQVDKSYTDASLVVMPENPPELEQINLPGVVNRRNAYLAMNAVMAITKEPPEKLIQLMNKFPGVSRRMEMIKPNIYTDYAHTPEKIMGAIEIAQELAKKTNKSLVVVYEPLTNRRMHHTKEQHHDLFNSVTKLYWVPSYLAREDPGLPVLHPTELIMTLNPDTQAKAEPAELDKTLKKAIKSHQNHGGLVLCLSGGGGGSLDEWLRRQFSGWF